MLMVCHLLDAPEQHYHTCKQPCRPPLCARRCWARRRACCCSSQTTPGAHASQVGTRHGCTGGWRCPVGFVVSFRPAQRPHKLSCSQTPDTSSPCLTLSHLVSLPAPHKPSDLTHPCPAQTTPPADGARRSRRWRITRAPPAWRQWACWVLSYWRWRPRARCKPSTSTRTRLGWTTARWAGRACFAVGWSGCMLCSFLELGVHASHLRLAGSACFVLDAGGASALQLRLGLHA